MPATHVGSGGWIVSDVNGDFCDSYVLFSEAIPVAAAPILLTLHAVYGGIEPFVAGAGFIIDNEIFRIVAVDMENFQITAARGCVDTVPAAHLSQTIAWFIDDVQMLAEEWTSGVTIDVRLLSQTSSDLLDLADAPVDTLTLVGRQGRPYPPGQFKINGVAYPDTTPGSVGIDPVYTSASSSDPDMPPTPDYVATDAGGEQWMWWAFNGQKIVGGITLTGGETVNGKSIAAMLNGAEVQYTTGNPSGSAIWMTTGIAVAGLDDTGASLGIHFPGIACRAIRLYKGDGQIGVIGATLDAGGITFRTPPDEITIAWAHRDRILQADQLIDTSMGNIGPEPGTTYRVRIYTGDTLIRIYEGITGTTCSYVAADEIADGGPFSSLRVVLEAQRDGLTSHQAHDWTVTRS